MPTALQRTPPRHPIKRALPPLLALLALCATLTACGSGSGGAGSSSSATKGASSSTASTKAPTPSSSDASASSLPSISPASVVATVAAKPITWAMLRHQMAIGPRKREVPEPPQFSACIAHQRSAKPSSSTEALKQECQKLYEEMLGPALGSLINSRWLLGHAAEAGLHIDKAGVQRELAQETKGQEATIAAQGETLSDIRQIIVLQQISNRIAARVKGEIPRLTPALIARYYAQHKRSYALPEQRDLYILRTVSEASAKKARQEIEAGKSFASLANASALPQPVHTENGFLKGLTPGYFSEPVLSDAIFKAPLHVLSGPVKISLGYYDFEVTKITPPHQKTLAEVRGSLQKQLPEQLRQETLAKAAGAFKAKWRARTDCRPGFVVSGCKQFKGQGSAEDQYTF